MGWLYAASALAADHVILGLLMTVKDPAGTEAGRRIIVAGREMGTGIASISDPTGAGATLTVIANGGLDSAETYALDASGWTALGALGFRYAGPTGADGDPVKRLVIKRTSGGVALVKVLLRGDVGTQPLAVVPPNPGDDGGLVLDVAGGDRYCVKLGGAAGGSERQDTASAWRVVRATAEDGCPTPPPTTSTSTTSTTLPPVCGNAQLEGGEACDGTLHLPSCDPLAGFGCQEPGHPDECTCCGDGDCDAIAGIPCCGEGVTVSCTQQVTIGSFCAACTVGASCGALIPHAPAVQCCGDAECARFDGLVVYCCWPTGHACTAGSECCSNSCNVGTGTCDCTPSGQLCLYHSTCCSGFCNGIACG